MEQKFYRCSHCGKIIAVVKETGVPVICCGEKMQEIVPNTVDAAQENTFPSLKSRKTSWRSRLVPLPIPCLMNTISNGFPGNQGRQSEKGTETRGWSCRGFCTGSQWWCRCCLCLLQPAWTLESWKIMKEGAHAASSLFLGLYEN